MKKIIVLLVLMIFSSTVFGQKDRVYKPEKVIHAGVKAGLNVAKVPEILEEIKDNKSKLGLNAGLSATYTVTYRLQLQLDALYSQQGTETQFNVKSSTFGNFDLPTELRLDYINIPLILNYEIFRKAWIGVGPQIGIMIYDRGRTTETITLNSDGQTFNLPPFEGTVEEFFQAVSIARGVDYDVKKNKVDYSIIFNGKYEIFDNFFVEGRYQLGLTDIIESPSIEVSPKNSVFSFGVIYNFL